MYKLQILTAVLCKACVSWEFLGGPVDKTTLPMLGSWVLSPVRELRSYILQPSTYATTTEPVRSRAHTPQLESLWAATKTQRSQNK